MKKKIAFILFATLLTASLPVFAASTNEIKDQVNDNNEKIDILEQEKSDLQKNKKVVNSELDAIINEIKSTADGYQQSEQQHSSKRREYYSKNNSNS